MQLNTSILKATFQKKSYTWDPLINIVGIRTTLQVPDVFNDLLCVVWKQNQMPSLTAPMDIQNWLNSNLFIGKNGKPLTVDGDLGENTEYALANYRALVGTERFKSYVITTDPGTYWLNNPMSKLGTAVLKPGQYVNSHSIGFHQGKPEHRALVQTGGLTVYRDGDKDSLAEAAATTETGKFGINIHGANKNGITAKIGQWSAGCMVFNLWSNKEEFIGICDLYRTAKGNKYTYNLIEEKDLI